jgi:hypothetical protein
MSHRNARTVGAGIALTAVLALAVTMLNARWVAADPGWKYNIPWLGGCEVDCIPIPDLGVHCPCYEMPPIIIEG